MSALAHTASLRLNHRMLPCAIVLLAYLILNRFRSTAAARLGNEAFVTGYSLATIVFFLLLLGIRKRFTSVPWGPVAVWQRVHHYLGIMSVGAYALHAKLMTTGWLESFLAISFWTIALSGLISWYVNRTAPQLLRAAGPQILRHDIPEAKKRVALQAHHLALAAAGQSDSAALSEHYQAALQVYFAKSRSLLFQLSPSGARRRQLLASLENADRYLDENGRSIRQQMSALVQSKDDLDFQSAIQNRIRFWASFHTWILGAFVILTIVHVVVAHQFSASW
jgi:hypothetical protein